MVNGILFSFFLIPEVKIGKWGPWLGTVSMRRCGNLQGGVCHPIPSPGSSTNRAGSVDPQSPTLGFLSDHRCTYLESAYHTDTLKSVAFQRKPTRMGAGGWGKAVPPPSSSRVKRPELTSCSSHRSNLAPWGKTHLPCYSLSLWRDRG